MDQAEQIAQFLTELPETIRNSILFRVLVYAFDFAPSKDSDLKSITIEKLTGAIEVRRVSAVLRTVGVVDFLLEQVVAIHRANEARLPIYAQRAEEIYKDDQETRDTMLKMVEQQTLSRQINLRHAESALQSWTSLRSNVLSFGALINFADACLKEGIFK